MIRYCETQQTNARPIMRKSGSNIRHRLYKIYRLRVAVGSELGCFNPHPGNSSLQGCYRQHFANKYSPRDHNFHVKVRKYPESIWWLISVRGQTLDVVVPRLVSVEDLLHECRSRYKNLYGCVDSELPMRGWWLKHVYFTRMCFLWESG